MRTVLAAAVVLGVVGGTMCLLQFVIDNASPLDGPVDWLLNDVLGASWWNI